MRRYFVLTTALFLGLSVSQCCVAQENNIINEMTVAPMEKRETLEVEQLDDVLFEGMITDEENVKEFAFTAPYDGRYCFNVEDVKANCSVSLYVNDSYGNGVTPPNNCVYRELEADETYTIIVKQYTGITEFSIRVQMQKPTVEITDDISIIKDQFVFHGQVNYYTFCPEIDGAYTFNYNKGKPDMALWDEYGEVPPIKLWGGAYVLNAGTEYTFGVYEDNTMGPYELEIMRQKEAVDITGYTVVNDSVECRNQRNNYTFKAPADGTYGFYTSTKNVNSSAQTKVYIFDDNGSALLEDSYGGNEIVLDAGDEVLVSIHQGNYSDAGNNNTGRYQLLVTYPEEAQDYLSTFEPGTSLEDDEPDSSDPEKAQLQKRVEELESELSALQDKYDVLMEIVGEIGLEISDEDFTQE